MEEFHACPYKRNIQNASQKPPSLVFSIIHLRYLFLFCLISFELKREQINMVLELMDKKKKS